MVGCGASKRSMSYISTSMLVSMTPLSCHCHVVPGGGLQRPSATLLHAETSPLSNPSAKISCARAGGAHEPSSTTSWITVAGRSFPDLMSPPVYRRAPRPRSVAAATEALRPRAKHLRDLGWAVKIGSDRWVAPVNRDQLDDDENTSDDDRDNKLLLHPAPSHSGNARAASCLTELRGESRPRVSKRGPRPNYGVVELQAFVEPLSNPSVKMVSPIASVSPALSLPAAGSTTPEPGDTLAV